MEIRYYVYALDIDKDCVTAALSCPDAETARRVFRAVSKKMKAKDDADRFHFGCAEVDVSASKMQSALRSLDSTLRSRFVRPDVDACRDISPRKRDLNNLNIDELEAAELETEKVFSGSQPPYKQPDILFMHHVKQVLAELAGNDASSATPSPIKKISVAGVTMKDGEDIADFIKRLEKLKKGHWVPRTDFENPEKNTKAPFAKNYLHNQRHVDTSGRKREIEWSKLYPPTEYVAIGMDRAQNFFRRTGYNKHKFEYEYFLLSENAPANTS